MPPKVYGFSLLSQCARLFCIRPPLEQFRFAARTRVDGRETFPEEDRALRLLHRRNDRLQSIPELLTTLLLPPPDERGTNDLRSILGARNRKIFQESVHLRILVAHDIGNEKSRQRPLRAGTFLQHIGEICPRNGGQKKNSAALAILPKNIGVIAMALLQKNRVLEWKIPYTDALYVRNRSRRPRILHRKRDCTTGQQARKANETHFFCNTLTVSMCAVWGNMSTGCTDLSS